MNSSVGRGDGGARPRCVVGSHCHDVAHKFDRTGRLVDIPTVWRKVARTHVLRWGLFLIVMAPAQPDAVFAAQGDCSQPLTQGSGPTASDCLFVLQAAVDSKTCDPACMCDANGDSTIAASDALICLKNAVGQAALSCSCPELWIGEWQSYYSSDRGELRAELKVKSSGFDGSLSLDGSPCFGDGVTGPITGKFSGASITGHAVFKNYYEVTFTGTYTPDSPYGDCMDGDDYYVTNGCDNDRGTWQLCRQGSQPPSVRRPPSAASTGGAP